VKQYLLVVCCLLAAQWVSGQSAIRGRVITADSLKPVSDVHVINKNLLKGDLTNSKGEFSIEARPYDTLVFSNISFQYEYVFLGASFPLTGWQVKLRRRDFMLEEVSIFAYELTSNKDVEMPIKKSTVIPMDKDIKIPEPVPPTLMNPVDYLYDLFGNRPKQLRELSVLLAEEYYRTRLEQGTNRSILKQLTGLNDADLEAFVFFCKFSNTRIEHQTDYELLMSLLACFDEYQAQKELEDVLDRN
jgi:hypothetical protein